MQVREMAVSLILTVDHVFSSQLIFNACLYECTPYVGPISRNDGCFEFLEYPPQATAHRWMLVDRCIFIVRGGGKRIGLVLKVAYLWYHFGTTLRIPSVTFAQPWTTRCNPHIHSRSPAVERTTETTWTILTILFFLSNAVSEPPPPHSLPFSV